MIPAVRRPIGRSAAAEPCRLRPRRVCNACAARGAAAENLLTLLKAVVGAVHGARWALQAERLLFTLSVCRLLRAGDQRGGHQAQRKDRSAHEGSLPVQQVLSTCKRSFRWIVPRAIG